MVIIPVMDIQGGKVVQARSGLRSGYRPIRSPLCRDARPASVLQDFLEIYRFKIIYMADLDAIEGKGNNEAVMEELSVMFPELTVWLDRGNRETRQGTEQRRWTVKPVIGSETGINPAGVSRFLAVHGDAVLSLDFLGEAFSGDPELLVRADIWPENVIVMCLHRVGTDQGPDTVLLDRIRSYAAGRRIFLAGGVRHHGDLVRLREEGVAGVLLATALHSRRISRADIQSCH